MMPQPYAARMKRPSSKEKAAEDCQKELASEARLKIVYEVMRLLGGLG